MNAALVYLRWNSSRNRLLSSVKRLRNPRYLVGAVLAAWYFGWVVLRGFFLHGAMPSPSKVLISPLVVTIGAVLLSLFSLTMWIFPQERKTLAFSEAEVGFLFPAPLTRRRLIDYKLTTSAIRILFSALLFAFFTSGLSGGFLARTLALWLLFSVLSLHQLVASFARSLLRGKESGSGVKLLSILAGVLFGALVVYREQFAGRRLSLPELHHWGQRLVLLTLSGPLHWLLLPSHWLLAPLLAPDWAALSLAMLPAIALLALHYYCVIRLDAVYQKRFIDLPAGSDRDSAALRAASDQQRSRRPPFILKESGAPWIALLWKNLISSAFANVRMWAGLLGIAMILAIFCARSNGGAVQLIIGVLSGFAIVWSVFAGAQICRQDFRQDLLRADLLKTFPLRSWQVALGELLAPWCILTFLQWLSLLVAAACLARVAPPQQLVMGVLVAAIFLPLLDMLLLMIANATALLLPTWVLLSGRGFEVFGQRMLLTIGQLLALLLCLLPTTLVFALGVVLSKLFFSLQIALFAGLLATTPVLLLELFAGLNLVGKCFERLDLSTELLQVE